MENVRARESQQRGVHAAVVVVSLRERLMQFVRNLRSLKRAHARVEYALCGPWPVMENVGGLFISTTPAPPSSAPSSIMKHMTNMLSCAVAAGAVAR